MWPFSSRKSREERIEECDHEWDEYEHVTTHPQYIYHDEGQPFVHKLTVRGKECENCPATKEVERSEKKIYFAVDRVEQIE